MEITLFGISSVRQADALTKEIVTRFVNEKMIGANEPLDWLTESNLVKYRVRNGKTEHAKSVQVADWAILPNRQVLANEVFKQMSIQFRDILFCATDVGIGFIDGKQVVVVI